MASSSFNDFAAEYPGVELASVNGLDFGYIEKGSGPLVLCLHGFADTPRSFAPLLDALAAAGFHAVAPFMRGYAPTSLAADGDYGLPALAMDVVALIDHFTGERAAVVGHDLGAVAAYAAVNLRPDRISRLVTAAMPHPRRLLLRPNFAQLSRSSYILGFQWQGRSERRLARDDFAALERLAERASPGWSMTHDDWVEIKTALADPERLHAALSWYRGLRRVFGGGDDWQLATSPVEVPSLLLYGARDGVIGGEMFEKQQHLFLGGLEVVRMETGHYLHREQPQEFARRVTAFLKPG